MPVSFVLATSAERAEPRYLHEPARPLSPAEIKHEWLKCSTSYAYFIDTYCKIYDAAAQGWIPFGLWPAQVRVLNTVHISRYICILKARQLGLTWLMLGYALWLIIFKPVATISVFSRRQTEADYLLGVNRLRGMFLQLPKWMQLQEVTGNTQEWALSNGSVARSFPTTAGDSYTATFALADEFDLVDDQNFLLQAVKPTIADGGKMILLSRADKEKPLSQFKRIYRGGKRNDGGWVSIFLPWHVHPKRNAAWYDDMVADSVVRTGGKDSVYEQYPATDVEALAPNSSDKRFPLDWLLQCYQPRLSLPLAQFAGAPGIRGLLVYSHPRPGRAYVVTGDPAEGNVTSDDSSCDIVDYITGEQCAHFAAKMEPDTFAHSMAQISNWYNRAPILPERNNHGHQVIAWLRNNGYLDRMLKSPTDDEPGWLATQPSKVRAYDTAAVCFREKDAVVHNDETYEQLANIVGKTLKAPELMMDDRATSFVLGMVARTLTLPQYVPVATAYEPRVPAPRSGAMQMPPYGASRGTHVVGGAARRIGN